MCILQSTSMHHPDNGFYCPYTSAQTSDAALKTFSVPFHLSTFNRCSIKYFLMALELAAVQTQAEELPWEPHSSEPALVLRQSPLYVIFSPLSSHLSSHFPPLCQHALIFICLFSPPRRNTVFRFVCL